MPTVSEIVADPGCLSFMSNEELYTIPPKDVEELQLRLLQRRFKELSPKIGVVKRLAEDLGIRNLDNVGDITSLCLPHTFYKSYAIGDVEKGRWDRLTRWFSTLTAVDLSKVDVSSCDSLESWLAAIEAHTPIRPLCSSGTSGKISFFPRTTTEEKLFIRSFLLCVGKFRSELDSGLASGDVDFLGPWPFVTGNHSFSALLRLLREHAYIHRPGEHIHTLGKTHWNIDFMWRSARLRAAESKGDSGAIAVLKDQLSKIRGRVVDSEDETARNIDEFMREMIVNQRGRKVLLFTQPKDIYSLTLECEKRGVKPGFAPDSSIYVLGSATSKGGTMPEGWLERCKAIFPFEYQNYYAMSECTAMNRLCQGGHYHLPPWTYSALLDPETSQPHPRSGVQTGRLALFDLFAENCWGGIISGDRVTVNWDGGCRCGRIGAYLHSDIIRYSNLKDDDKITCSKTADAYEKAVDYYLGSGSG